MKSVYYREQKTICGESISEAGYMEVDIYPVTPSQHKQSIRAKKKQASSLAQQAYNDKMARRYHVQLVNTNFGDGDYSWTGTYDDEHLPDPVDRDKAVRDWSNYMKRVYRYCDRNEIERPRWVMATEFSTILENGESVGRTHHHAIIKRTDGLTRDILEDLWRDRNGESLGFCRCEYLRTEHGTVEGLVQYISKNKKCDRAWRQSRGLKKPITPRPNDVKWSRKKLEEASTLYIDDREYWESQYEGYTLDRVETQVTDAGARHTTVILYKDTAKLKKKGRRGKLYEDGT